MKEEAKDKPPILHHYCSVEAFFGIISSKILWLTSSKYANDPDENLICLKILEKIGKKNKYKDKNNQISEIFHQNIFHVDELSANVFCMSEVPDDLNQWRIYGDNGRGVMLEIMPNYFIENKLCSLNLDGGFNLDQVALEKCIYDIEAQEIFVENLFDEAYPQFLELEEKYKNNPSELSQEKFNLISKIKLALVLQSSIYKHKSYYTEREWRMTCFALNPNISPGYQDAKYKLKYRAKRDYILPYVDLPIFADGLKSTPFRKIMLGPNYQGSTWELDSILKTYGIYSTMISKSQLRMR